MFLCESGQALEEFLGGYFYAAFALNWFDQKSSGLFRNRRLDCFQVIEKRIDKTGEKRAEAIVNLPLSRGRHCSDRSAVEGLIESDDFMTCAFDSMSPGELDEAVIGFCS